MRKELIALREKMAEHGLEWYIIPSEDYHFSEYVHDFFKGREYVSGFTGSAGTLLVGMNSAHLWTDGRYFLQAEDELWDSGIELMEMGEIGTPELIDFLANARRGGKLQLGFDGRLISDHKAAEYRKLGITLTTDLDLVGEIWKDRPAIEPSDVYDLPMEIVGRSTQDKLADIRQEMEKKGADYLLLTDLMELAWLTNKRASDVANTPVFYGYGLISMEDVQIFTMQDMLRAGASKVDPEEDALRNIEGEQLTFDQAYEAEQQPEDEEEDVRSKVDKTHIEMVWDTSDMESAIIAGPVNQATPEEGFRWRKYDEIQDALSELPEDKTIWIDGTVASCSLAGALPAKMKRVDQESPLELLKAVKNELEIASTRKAHLKDGVAMIQFSAWLKRLAARAFQINASEHTNQSLADFRDIIGEDGSIRDAGHTVTEIYAADKLQAFREAQPGLRDLSFPTISAYDAHGAIVHYEPTSATDIPLKPQGFLLVDSGAQFVNGTTDITRTYALGPLTEEMKRDYTLVLKSHIALSSATFDAGTTDKELDVIARKPLKDVGLDFKHGTGHGVGHLLSVHEGPNRISPNAPGCVMQPGMITTDEPGLYISGRFGIRLENELLCVELPNGKLGFEPLTYCPFEREAILVDMLTARERAWVDSYHRMVRETMEDRVSPEAATWLIDACMAL